MTYQTDRTELETNFSQNLVGLWEFAPGNKDADTGLADGQTQDGTFFCGAYASNGSIILDGKNDHFDVDGNDAPFDLSTGTVQTQFTQHTHVGTSPDTIVSRGETNDASTEGAFHIQVTQSGAVTVYHNDHGQSVSLSTGNGFSSVGDDVRVSYSWDENGQGSFIVENLTTGETFAEDFDSTGLTMDITDNDDESWTIGAEEYDDGKYNHYFDGEIGYVAVYNKNILTDNATPDGYVDGTDGDDLIDAAYTGDPEGDMVDAGDAVLPGEEGDDDIILAGDGDDVVYGGAGDDEIYGDRSVETTYTDAAFNWSDVDSHDLDNGDDLSGETVTAEISGVKVSITMPDESDRNGIETSYSTTKINTDGLDDAESRSSIKSLAQSGESGTYKIDFSEPVENVAFNITDIDVGKANVTVIAYDEAGTEIPVDFDYGSRLELNGNTISNTSTSDASATAGSNTATISVQGPVASIEVIHEDVGSGYSGIYISDIDFDAPTGEELVDGDGDDTLYGGAGDDVIYGQDGNDTLSGGEGNDKLSGGADADTIYAGAGDKVDGGSEGDDNDVLDLTGQGSFYLENVTEDSNGNGFDGTVVFVNSDGLPTGETLTFTEIEKVVGDEVNRAPDAKDDSASTAYETPVTIDVLANDTDADGDALEITAVRSDDGTVEVNEDNTLTFTPNEGFSGEATITYVVSDGEGGSDTAEVTVTVAPRSSDGIVSGDDNDNLIDLNYGGDPDGDLVDAGDAILPGEAENDDIIDAKGGNDTIYAGLGDDEIDGGAGNDTIYGESGDDTIVDAEGSETVYGGTGDDVIDVAGGDSPDTIDELLSLSDPNNLADLDYSPYSETIAIDSDPTDDIDTVYGGEGDDTIKTGDDADTVYGGGGDDTIYSGIDDDTVYGGAGDDHIEDVQGADFIDGGDGHDTIIAGFDTFSDYDGDDKVIPNAGYPFTSDQNQTDGIDTVYGGAGNDKIYTGDDADVIYGGTGNDYIDAGIDDDYVEGGEGNDTIMGGHGSDEIYGGAGDDYIDASDVNGVVNYTDEDDATDPRPDNDRDFVSGGDGNDTIIGGDDQDILYGDAGNDTVYGGLDVDVLYAGAGTDHLYGGAGNDVLHGGGENDVLDGGDDRDVIIIDEFGTPSGGYSTTVHGGSGGDDWDTLDLSQMLANGWTITLHVENGENGQIDFYNSGINQSATINYTDIEKIIPCFTPGTLIATPQGERAVETLEVGDKVVTRDNGLQVIRWVGKKTLSAAELKARKELAPVRIRQGALGCGLPERDMIVSPNHRILVISEKAELLFEDHEVLVAAKHLVGREGIESLGATDVTYIHIMFDRHEVVLSDGAWTESFQPGDYTLAGIGEESREEIFALFPELREATGRGGFVAARRILRKHEAALLNA